MKYLNYTTHIIIINTHEIFGFEKWQPCRLTSQSASQPTTSFNINSSEMYSDFCCMSFLTSTFLLFQDFKVKTAMKMSMIVLETCAKMAVPVWMGSTGIHVNVH